MSYSSCFQLRDLSIRRDPFSGRRAAKKPRLDGFMDARNWGADALPISA